MGRSGSWGGISDVPGLVLRTLVGEWDITSLAPAVARAKKERGYRNKLTKNRPMAKGTRDVIQGWMTRVGSRELALYDASPVATPIHQGGGGVTPHG